MGLGVRFVKNFVLSLGVVGGVLAKAGLDPEGVMVVELLPVVSSLEPPFYFLAAIAFTFVLIVLPVIELLGGFIVGGVLGIVAIALGWFGGFIFPSEASVFLILIALALGIIAPHSKDLIGLV